MLYSELKEAKSQLVHLKKFSLNFSSSLFGYELIFPSLTILYYLFSVFLYVLHLVNYYFVVFYDLNVTVVLCMHFVQ